METEGLKMNTEDNNDNKKKRNINNNTYAYSDQYKDRNSIVIDKDKPPRINHLKKVNNKNCITPNNIDKNNNFINKKMLKNENISKSLLSIKTINPNLLTRSGLSVSPVNSQYNKPGADLSFELLNIINSNRDCGEGVSFSEEEEDDDDDDEDDVGGDGDDGNNAENENNEDDKDDNDDKDDKDNKDDKDDKDDIEAIESGENNQVKTDLLVTTLKRKLNETNIKWNESKRMVDGLSTELRCREEEYEALKRYVDMKKKRFMNKIEKIRKKYRKLKEKCKLKNIELETTSGEESEREEFTEKIENSDSGNNDAINFNEIRGKIMKNGDDYDWCYKLLYEISMNKLIYLESLMMTGVGDEAKIKIKSIVPRDINADLLKGGSLNRDIFHTNINKKEIEGDPDTISNEGMRCEMLNHSERRVSSCPDLQAAHVERIRENILKYSILNLEELKLKNTDITKELKGDLDTKRNKTRIMELYRKDINRREGGDRLTSHLAKNMEPEDTFFSRQSVQYRHVKPRKTLSERLRDEKEENKKKDIEREKPTQSYSSLPATVSGSNNVRNSLPVERNTSEHRSKMLISPVRSNYDRLCMRRNGLGSLRLKSIGKASSILSRINKNGFISHVKSSK